MSKYIDIIKAIATIITKLKPKSCRSKCCSGSECECGQPKNLINEEEEKDVEPTVRYAEV
tara:strand:- start:5924 stop:6103 length:180 start_codon:yes stop_codon:yes gene_type:complete